jgi:hypothetical protein
MTHGCGMVVLAMDHMVGDSLGVGIVGVTIIMVGDDHGLTEVSVVMDGITGVGTIGVGTTMVGITIGLLTMAIIEILTDMHIQTEEEDPLYLEIL